MLWWNLVKVSEVGKLSCLLEEGAGEADDGKSWGRVNVCRHEQSGQGRVSRVGWTGQGRVG